MCTCSHVYMYTYAAAAAAAAAVAAAAAAAAPVKPERPPVEPRCPLAMDNGQLVLLRGMKSGELIWAWVRASALCSHSCSWRALAACMGEELARKHVSMARIDIYIYMYMYALRLAGQGVQS